MGARERCTMQNRTHVESFIGEKGKKGAEERRGRRREEKKTGKGRERRCRRDLVGGGGVEPTS